ncbi:hypothetical protein A8709_32420 [Paenibacillus pectinilyticus]|uniref:ORF6C domain-containing protein n=1 Tax=Paenibacillus pectinilyticus TaxID=512399 RepID=A0A1C0ZWW6_9BACL|nr:ORF6C domain-containing protein [Paenibacillus pectinilyticus]OCT12528.1 hypothetical protein A8709_32420 [Paenibacillus pectinilyticus]
MLNNSNVLMESKSLRESLIERVEILDKIKRLEMLEDDIHLTIEMVSNFYEVSVDVIRKVSVRRKEELESDGMKTIVGKELKDMKSFCQIKRNAGRLTLFTRRSVLRVGMLLEDSSVAVVLRDMLLDKQEKKTQAEFESLSPQLQFMIQVEQRQNALEAQNRILENQNTEIIHKNNELQQSVNHLTLVVVNEVFVDDHQKADIQNAVFSRIGKLKSMGYETHFQSLFRALKVHFNVPKYDKIKRVDFDRAMEFVSGWFPKLKEGTN